MTFQTTTEYLALKIGCCLPELLRNPEDESSAYPGKVCEIQLDDTASHFKRQYTSIFGI
jgi:hypothetical protein